MVVDTHSLYSNNTAVWMYYQEQVCFIPLYGAFKIEDPLGECDKYVNQTVDVRKYPASIYFDSKKVILYDDLEHIVEKIRAEIPDAEVVYVESEPEIVYVTLEPETIFVDRIEYVESEPEIVYVESEPIIEYVNQTVYVESEPEIVYVE